MHYRKTEIVLRDFKIEKSIEKENTKYVRAKGKKHYT
jgi:hypothetical protein